MSSRALHPSARQRGLTMIELIVFIVIVAIGVVGILQVMRLTTANSADPVRSKQALMIAESLLEEVALAGFTYCDPTSANADSAAGTAQCAIPEAWGQLSPEPVGARPYDNVNDYVGAANTPTAAFDAGGVLTDASGRSYNVQGFTARLRIFPEALGPAGSQVGSVGTSADTEMLHIRVEVSYDNQTLALDGYRARYAPKAL